MEHQTTLERMTNEIDNGIKQFIKLWDWFNANRDAKQYTCLPSHSPFQTEEYQEKKDSYEGKLFELDNMIQQAQHQINIQTHKVPPEQIDIIVRKCEVIECEDVIKKVFNN